MGRLSSHCIIYGSNGQLNLKRDLFFTIVFIFYVRTRFIFYRKSLFTYLSTLILSRPHEKHNAFFSKSINFNFFLLSCTKRSNVFREIHRTKFSVVKLLEHFAWKEKVITLNESEEKIGSFRLKNIINFPGLVTRGLRHVAVRKALSQI